MIEWHGHVTGSDYLFLRVAPWAPAEFALSVLDIHPHLILLLPSFLVASSAGGDTCWSELTHRKGTKALQFARNGHSCLAMGRSF